MTNPFEAVATAQMTGAQKSKERVAQKWADKRVAKDRPPTDMEKKQADDAVLAILYQRWRREIKDKIAKKHGKDFAELMRLIRGLEWGNVQTVVDFVADAWWLRRADADTRFHTLIYITSSVIRSRTRAGLLPFDDGIPMLGEPPCPSVVIRNYLS